MALTGHISAREDVWREEFGNVDEADNQLKRRKAKCPVAATGQRQPQKCSEQEEVHQRNQTVRRLIILPRDIDRQDRERRSADQGEYGNPSIPVACVE